MGDEWYFIRFVDAPLSIIDGDRGNNYPKQEDFLEIGHCLFLNAGNVTKSGFNFSNCAFISEKRDALLRKGKLNREDIVLTTRGTLGNIAYYDDSIPFEHIRINSGMVILRTNRDHLLPEFLYQFLRSEVFDQQIKAFLSGSAQPQIPIRNLNEVEIPIPPLSEQRRIAEILGTWDEAIALTERLIEALTYRKRGLMQALLTGAVRFSEFGDDWNIAELEQVTRIEYGKSPQGIQDDDGQYPIYGTGGIVGRTNNVLSDQEAVIIGRKGTINQPQLTLEPFWAIDTTFFCTPKSGEVTVQ